MSETPLERKRRQRRESAARCRARDPEKFRAKDLARYPDRKVKYRENPTPRREAAKRYAQRNPDKIAARWANYYRNNKYRLNRRAQEDLQHRLRVLLRGRLHSYLRCDRTRIKSGSTVKDLGCSISDLISYLESKFQPGMSWGNRGTRGWHVDHIRPLASFDLSDRAQFLQAFHYTNLQPLWAADNLRKGSKVA
jgi:hypothetical protein